MPMLVLVGVTLWNKRVLRDNDSQPVRTSGASVPLLNAGDADQPPSTYAEY